MVKSGSHHAQVDPPHLKRADGGDAAVGLPLVVVAGEGPLERRARVLQVHVLLHGDVAPVRDLDDPRHAGDGQERVVVLIVDFERVLDRKETSPSKLWQQRSRHEYFLFFGGGYQELNSGALDHWAPAPALFGILLETGSH